MNRTFAAESCERCGHEDIAYSMKFEVDGQLFCRMCHGFVYQGKKEVTFTALQRAKQLLEIIEDANRYE